MLTGTFKKSSYSNGGGCVEARVTDTGAVQVKDSKLTDSPVLSVSAADWKAVIGRR
ncbi:DUF397 domain-containing protein [Salininema proteolyticum]|uniref:DUF397 domain-containing protein n=1 Tax=Salininema proteolyticum TaxID=1607685 RepID=A0ABV8U4Z2_9ACTN